MSVQTYPGASIPWGYPEGWTAAQPAFASTLVIDATGEKVAFCGRVRFPARTGSKDIRKVGFRFGAVTKAGGSGLTVSLQNVSTAAGNPMQPDETQDQTVAIDNGNAAFAANTWIQTGNLSADRTVNHGELLAVVIEYDGSGRQGSDSVVVSGLSGVQAGPFHGGMSVLKTASWAAVSVVPNVILEFSDGTFGTLDGAFPCSNISTIALNTGSAADEVALEFAFQGPKKIDGFGGIVSIASGADIEVICYAGTTAMTNGTVGLLSLHGTALSSHRQFKVTLAEMLSLSASTTYRLAVKPTSGNSITVNYFEVNDANHLQAHVGGPSWAYTTRVDAGSWAAPTATRRPFLWPYVCGDDDGAGAGGGGGRRPRLVTVQ